LLWIVTDVPAGAAPDEGPANAHVELATAGADAADAVVRAYWDEVADERLAGEARATVAGGARSNIEVTLDTDRVDGPRTLVIVASSGAAEVIEEDNTRSLGLYVPADLGRGSRQTHYSVDLHEVPRHDPVVELEADFGRVAGGRPVDPSSVRVALVGPDGNRVLPTQFAPAEGNAGLVSFILEGEWQGTEEVDVTLVAAPSGESPTLPPVAHHFDAETGIVTRETYAADVSGGDLRPVGFGRADGGAVALRRVIFSSGESGWGEDEGELLSLELLEDGPVRTIVRTVRRLRSGVVVTRTYTFYASHFVVDVGATERQTGLMSRVWYGAHGQYEDSNGHMALADGSGQAEGVTENNAAPAWFCLRSDAWAHACIALTPVTGMSYWDEGNAIGQCGFHTVTADGNRYAHVLTGPRPSADFASQWHAALTLPPTVTPLR